MSDNNGDVIDWDEAMQQCGEDEEFLRELLADLRSETDTQMAKIEETIKVCEKAASCVRFLMLSGHNCRPRWFCPRIPS